MTASRPFVHHHRVSYAECTVGNHVYHSRYLDILEAARGEFMRSIGHPLAALQEAGYIFPVVEVHLRYLRPARYDDILEVAIDLMSLDALRLSVRHQVRCGQDTLLLEAETRHVCTSLAERPRRMPRPLMEALLPWLRETGPLDQTSEPSRVQTAG